MKHAYRPWQIYTSMYSLLFNDIWDIETSFWDICPEHIKQLPFFFSKNFFFFNILFLFLSILEILMFFRIYLFLQLGNFDWFRMYEL